MGDAAARRSPLPTVMRGLRLANGSWNTSACCLRTSRKVRRVRARARPGRRSGRCRLSGSISSRIERPVVDLPQPDSPTSASVSPARKVKEMFSTAWTRPETLPNRPRADSKARGEVRDFEQRALGNRRPYRGVSAGSSELAGHLVDDRKAHRPRPPVHRAEPRHGREQRAGIGMRAGCEDARGRAGLHRLARHTSPRCGPRSRRPRPCRG